MFFRFVTKQVCDGRTDGRTDGQNDDFQERASIAASRGKIQTTSISTITLVFLDRFL